MRICHIVFLITIHRPCWSYARLQRALVRAVCRYLVGSTAVLHRRFNWEDQRPGRPNSTRGLGIQERSHHARSSENEWRRPRSDGSYPSGSPWTPLLGTMLGDVESPTRSTPSPAPAVEHCNFTKLLSHQLRDSMLDIGEIGNNFEMTLW